MEEPNQKTTPSILIKFAELLGTEIKHGRLAIPEKYGKGYCAGFVFNKHLRMLINNYILNEDVIDHGRTSLPALEYLCSG